ncbi:Serine/threonine-protein kinase [Friedmanniomyces endolithicus]|uniref:non-specific serine/threonine protein kinase n=1 Tax=Friedmanniomyces endolithicus TaxID=329885 RepID=A0AAN6FXU7_9PEZI|nr:Serine/threonine-protein kinase [Friedmanniomyces endolithicus]
MLPQHQQEDPVAGQQHHPSSSSSATAHALPTEHMRAPKRSHSTARQDDARCVNSKATPASFRPPAPPPPTRRPGHLSSKSASAVPTLSTLSIVAPTSAPTPPLSPTRYLDAANFPSLAGPASKQLEHGDDARWPSQPAYGRGSVAAGYYGEAWVSIHFIPPSLTSHRLCDTMATADPLRSYSKPHHDEHDQIGSGTSTPPDGTGAATPRPDPTDKRLPGIINSYFAQFRDSLTRTRSKSSAEPSHPVPPPSEETEEKQRPSHAGPQDVASTARVSTIPRSSRAAEPHSHPSPSLVLRQKQESVDMPQASYPTPPLSNSSSFVAMASEARRAESTIFAPSRKRSWQQRKKSNATALPTAVRRHTLSAALSKPEVSVHISNPGPAVPQIVPASPSVARRSSRPSQDKEVGVLTQGAERHQNTPPQTPRTLSHVSRREDDVRQVPKAEKSSRSSSGNSHAATIGHLKGRLDISVQEGRGLRPSVEPYVVCIFQQNEDISGGPKDDAMDTAVDGESEPEHNMAKGVAMKRLGSGSGTPLSIPGMRSRQTSQTNISDLRRGAQKPEHQELTDPVWRHMATFDVVGENNEIDISVYDRAKHGEYLGHIRLPLNLHEYEHQHEDWYKLQPREGESTTITGEIHLSIAFHASGKKSFGPDDFEVLKLIGKGTFGQVFQVRKKDTRRIYAMKVLSKKVIIQKKEIQHTIGERNILVRTATTESPFIVGLKFSFQTSADLYLVTDYMSGGELFWHLQKEGRFVEERAKFYIAELILALRHLHQHNIVYRDLKPENILLDANGHIALCDFGLSKANLAKDDTTNTFCGTTEYLAPEVLLDEQGYTKMVDFWSLGVLVFEMCCGWSPFYAEDTQQMYKNIAFGKVRFPRDALSQEGRNFVKGLLNRNPSHRLGAKGDAEELMGHPFFHDIDWSALSKKLTLPPFKPKLKGELDTSNFDPEFTNALTGDLSSSLNARAAALASGGVLGQDSTPLSPTMQNQFKGFTFVDESTLEQQFGGREEGMGSSVENATVTNGRRSGDRMSGVESTITGLNASADGDFNQGMLEDI